MIEYTKASGQNHQNSLKECVFINSTQNTVPYCQKYTPTDSAISAILPTGKKKIYRN